MNYDDWKTESPEDEQYRQSAYERRRERLEGIAERRLQEWKDGERSINGKYRGGKREEARA